MYRSKLWTTLLTGGLTLVACVTLALQPAPAQSATGVFPMTEISFTLTGLTGNPFDYTENDIKVTLAGPGRKTVTVPAFFDGEETWRVRFTPRETGKYRVSEVTRNGTKAEAKEIKPAEFTVSGKSSPGFVRIDPKDPLRFAFDSGVPYYPVGHNVAWKSGDTGDVHEIFAKMGGLGENWSRVWMNHWDNKNLDWASGGKSEPGKLDLTVARRWDTIVQAAEKNGIYFQLTLQHHGQYSSTVNPNWGENPWNKALGGWLEKPEDFFTDARAKHLTKAKYRYIIARWGYSPSIMAWELYNEVQFTDAARKRQFDVVAAWHKEMADFLKEQDPYRHLVTTSSETSMPGLFDAVDFVQLHAYQSDPVTTVRAANPADWKKPIFFGEIGPAGDLNRDNGNFLRGILWASLVTESSGAAQYWTWDHIERANLYPHFAAFTSFLKKTGVTNLYGLRPVEAEVRTEGAGGILRFAPGAGWADTKGTSFPIRASGMVEGVENMSAYLQGNANRKMFPYAEFPVDLAQDATWTVTVGQSARNGAKVQLKVDGVQVAEKEFPAAERDTNQNAEITVTVPKGKRVLRLDNTGADWARLNRISLTPFGAALRALGKANATSAVFWLQNAFPDKPITGEVVIPNLNPGTYQILWWDSVKGALLSEEKATVAQDKRLTLKTPTVTQDVAVFIQRK